MIYYTADTHFGHANIIRFCNRPYANVQEMDLALIDNWNRKVRKEDTIYIVGDMIYRSAEAPERYLSALNGHKILVTGNHDHSWLKDADVDRFFEELTHMAIITDNDVRVTVN